MRAYIADPYWNEHHDGVIAALRDAGVTVFDYRDGDGGGSPEAIFGPDPHNLTAAEFTAALTSPIAREKLAADQRAIDECDVLVLLLPAGKSSHFEFGYAIAAGKRAIIMAPDGKVPAELVYALADAIVTDIPGLLSKLATADDLDAYIAAIADSAGDRA
jgi:nucleoside 2-deoxyribosyltransferase